MKVVLMIGAGSFIGGISRYLVSQFVHLRIGSAFPFGTLIVNISGCLLIGLVFGISKKYNIAEHWELFIITGILGGFTTFSAFSNETFSMLRMGQYLSAGLYIGMSVLLGLSATLAGYLVTK